MTAIGDVATEGEARHRKRVRVWSAYGTRSTWSAFAKRRGMIDVMHEGS
jgi:hypothetical protein